MTRVNFPMSVLLLGLAGSLSLGAAACGDDGDGTTGASATETTQSDTTTPTSETTQGETTGTTVAPTTAGPTTTTTTTSDSETETDTEGTTTSVDENLYATVIRGTMFTSDLAEAQATHDPLAAGGEATAMALGDFGHDALLGTTTLGTEENRFLGIDRWDNVDGMLGFYGDPMFQEGFLPFFDESGPLVEMFVERPDWYTWGDMTSGDEFGDYWFVVGRGYLADTPEATQPAHDALAMAGEPDVMAVGDVAHVIFLGLEDPQEFLVVDIWSDSAAIEAVYTDPDFQMGFSSIFAPDTATLEVYRSTDWHQW